MNVSKIAHPTKILNRCIWSMVWTLFDMSPTVLLKTRLWFVKSTLFYSIEEHDTSQPWCYVCFCLARYYLPHTVSVPLLSWWFRGICKSLYSLGHLKLKSKLFTVTALLFFKKSISEIWKSGQVIGNWCCIYQQTPLYPLSIFYRSHVSSAILSPQ